MGYVQGVAQNWAEGKKPRAVGKIVLPLVPVALVIALAAFLWIKRAVIVKVFSGIVFFLTVIFACTQGSSKGKEKTQSDAVTMKLAKQGLNDLLDNVFVVSESLAEQTEIYSPRTKGDLAWPDMKRCITLEDGVAVVTVQLDYAGDEIESGRFMERFNDRMAQKLNSGELSGKPPAVFYDKGNDPHTSIQAIRCIPVKGTRSIRLEVVRVNEAAVALMDKIDRERANEPNDRDTLYDDDL